MSAPRLELKVVAARKAAERYLASVAPYLTGDPHDPGDGYLVSTLYYDKRDLAGYRAKLDGLPRRTRVRLRQYGHEPGAFVEIRERIGPLVAKSRAPVELGALLARWRGLAPPLPLAGDAPDAAVRERADVLVRYGLQRATIVTHYRRRAWVGRWDPQVRITLDTRLTASPPPERDDLWTPSTREILPPTHGVLEIKGPSLPCWAASALAAAGLEPQRYSKFVQGVNVLGGRR